MGLPPTVIGEPTRVLVVVSITDTVLLPELVMYAFWASVAAGAPKQASAAAIIHATDHRIATTRRRLRRPSPATVSAAVVILIVAKAASPLFYWLFEDNV